jgi:hypothetical protein
VNYSTYLLCSLLPLAVDKVAPNQADGETLEQKLAGIFESVLQTACQLSQEYLSRPVDAETTFTFEHQVEQRLREAGRQMVQAVYNRVESAVASLPKHVHFEASQYTRLQRKTPQNVWTLFGQMRLECVGYRPTDKTGDPTIFPLALALGLIHGASPALAERAAGLLSDTGMTQQRVLKQLRQDHGVGCGVKKLRQVSAFLSAEMTEQRQEVQAGHKHPAIHLRMLAHKYPFDAVQMPLNPFDTTYRSFERQVLPEVERQGIAGLGMKSLGGDGQTILHGIVTVQEALRYAMSLPVATTISGIDSLEVLHQNLAVARGFQGMSPREMQALGDRCAAAAADGHLEMYKSTMKYDAAVGRQQHGFPTPEELPM